MAVCLCGRAGAQTRLTVEASVTEALAKSPQAQAATFAREAAQAQTDKEKPVARPTVTGTATGTVQGPRVTFPRPDGTDAIVLPDGLARLDLVVEQPLYRAGAGAARQRYDALTGITEADYRKALAEIALNARKAYLDVLKAESGVRTAQEGVDAAKRYQTLVQKQIEAGVAKPVDAQTAAAQMAEAQSGLTQAEGGLALARLNFNRALGRPLSTPVLLEPLSALPAIPDSPAAAIAVALEQRPEIRTLELNLQAAKAGVTLAKAQTSPMVNARGQVSAQVPATAFVHETYAAATIEVRWLLSDGGKARLDAQEAQAQVKRLGALLEDARQSMALDVTQAWQKMREAQARIALAQEQRKGAEATALVAEKAYEVGRGTAVEVQAAQREVRTAKERELQATYDLHGAALDFLRAQGTLLPAGNRK